MCLTMLKRYSDARCACGQVMLKVHTLVAVSGYIKSEGGCTVSISSEYQVVLVTNSRFIRFALNLASKMDITTKLR